MIPPIPKQAVHPILRIDQLLQNRPNPFSERTIIEVELSEAD